MPCGPSGVSSAGSEQTLVPGFSLRAGARTVVQHLAAELVAEHDVAGKIHRLAAGKMFCQFDHAVGMLARVQIGAADAAGQRLDQHLPCARLRLGHGVDDDLAVPENRSAHRRPPCFCSSSHSDDGERNSHGTARWPRRRARNACDQALGDGSPGTARSCERRTRSRWAV